MATNIVPSRKLPNIIITGTPGVGKTTTCTDLVSQTSDTPFPLTHLSISAVVKDKDCYDGYDEELNTSIVDEDKLLDAVEAILLASPNGGHVIDYHACDLFPPSWIDLVVVLRCQDTKVFYERMEERAYNEKKMQENIDAEIFGVLAEEAREGFDLDGDNGIVVELKSEKTEDVEANVERIVQWVEQWIKDHANDDG
jgi:broad-specificity NMP kinase